MSTVRKYVKSYYIPMNPESHEKIIGESSRYQFKLITYIHTEKSCEDCTKEYAKEIRKEFAGIEDGFFYSDDHILSNMIKDEKLVKYLRKLLDAGEFNGGTCDGYAELDVYIDL